MPTQVLIGDPRPQQDALPAPRRPGHERHPLRGRQHLVQALPCDNSAPGRGGGMADGCAWLRHSRHIFAPAGCVESSKYVTSAHPPAGDTRSDRPCHVATDPPLTRDRSYTSATRSACAASSAHAKRDQVFGNGLTTREPRLGLQPSGVIDDERARRTRTPPTSSTARIVRAAEPSDQFKV